MIDSKASGRYPGFAGIEYAHVRRVAYPSFEWRVCGEPSRGRRLERPVEAARVALVGTAGAFLRGQPAFSLGHDGDPSFREIPAAAETIRLAHVGYDVPRAPKDPDVVFPLALLRDMAAAGAIRGAGAPLLLVHGLRARSRAAAVRRWSRGGATVARGRRGPRPSGAVLTGLPAVGRTAQRVFDEYELATVSITQAPEITRLVKPSLACFVAHPFGLTLGAVGDKAIQRRVIERCLQQATRSHRPGTLVDLGLSWPDDLRERQLRKEAH